MNVDIELELIKVLVRLEDDRAKVCLETCDDQEFLQAKATERFAESIQSKIARGKISELDDLERAFLQQTVVEDHKVHPEEVDLSAEGLTNGLEPLVTPLYLRQFDLEILRRVLNNQIENYCEAESDRLDVSPADSVMAYVAVKLFPVTELLAKVESAQDDSADFLGVTTEEGSILYDALCQAYTEVGLPVDRFEDFSPEEETIRFLKVLLGVSLGHL